MGQSLHEIAQLLKESNKKVQLIYAFNGTGKTRLSRAFRLLVDPKEETATFLGYTNWKELLPNDAAGSREGYFNRILNLSSHSRFSGEEVADITDNEKRVLAYLVEQIKTSCNFN
jgi:wobble nucleotide-excising tRNase